MIVEDILRSAPVTVKAYDSTGKLVTEYVDSYLSYTDNYLEEIVALCHTVNPTVIRVVLDIALNLKEISDGST